MQAKKTQNRINITFPGILILLAFSFPVPSAVAPSLPSWAAARLIRLQYQLFVFSIPGGAAPPPPPPPEESTPPALRCPAAAAFVDSFLLREDASWVRRVRSVGKGLRVCGGDMRDLGGVSLVFLAKMLARVREQDAP